MEKVEEIRKSLENQKILETVTNPECFQDFQNFKKSCENVKTIEIFREMEKVENIYEKPKSCENVYDININGKICKISETVHFYKENRKVTESLYPHELLYKTELGRIILCFLIGLTISLFLSLFLNLGDF
jgi:hypothetical protein